MGLRGEQKLYIDSISTFIGDLENITVIHRIDRKNEVYSLLGINPFDLSI